MKSMTGYGKGVSNYGTKTLTVELKSVNNRFLEINSRLPKYLMAGDEIIRKRISAVLKRGSVDVYFDLKDTSCGASVCVDHELASLYTEAAGELSARFGIPDEFSNSDLMRCPDVITLVKDDESDVLCDMLDEAVSDAVISLNEMRETEGLTVKADFERLIDNIRGHLDMVKQRVPFVIDEYRAKLTKRIEEYLGSVEVDQAKLINEVAFFADKADINEEISRLDSHISQFVDVIESDGEAGRKLDFLAQEMNREINTMGSKSADIELLNHVVEMKNELEKIREQIRNVE